MSNMKGILMPKIAVGYGSSWDRLVTIYVYIYVLS